MSTWLKAYAGLEEQIHDLPRWVHIVQTLHDAKFGSGMDVPDERDEALTLAIDELYGHAVKLRDTYQRQLDELTGQVVESATTATEEAAAERSR
jgi:hypothetical protein